MADMAIMNSELTEQDLQSEEREREWQRMHRRGPSTVTPSPDFLRTAMTTPDAHLIRAIAFHEAGHVVIAVLEGVSVDSVYLTNERCISGWRIRGGGCSAYNDGPALTQVRVYVAGAEAVRMAGLGEAIPANWNGHDENKAGRVADGYMVSRQRENVRALLTRQWPAVDAVARALLERGYLSGDEAEHIVLSKLDDMALARRGQVAA
jgi:hypothetical protein